MANEDSVLKEVDQELAEERQWAMFRKYGPAAITGAAALVIGVAGWQFWNARQQSLAEDQAIQFESAVDTMVEDEVAGREAMDVIAQDGAGGYSVLARFHRASSFARAGERDAALAAFRRVYEDGAAPERLRDLARLRAAYLALSEGRDAVLEHLGDLANAESAFSHHANEVAGLAALEAGDYETALSTFRQLTLDVGTPEPVRERAEEFAALAAAAKSGVNITGAARLEDVLEAVGESAAGETAPEDAPVTSEGGDAGAPAEEDADAEPEASAASSPDGEDAVQAEGGEEETPAEENGSE